MPYLLLLQFVLHTTASFSNMQFVLFCSPTETLKNDPHQSLQDCLCSLARAQMCLPHLPVLPAPKHLTLNTLAALNDLVPEDIYNLLVLLFTLV